MMQSYNFFPLISRPTRLPLNNSTGSPSLLDHIWTNFTVPSSPGILLSPLSDHLPVFLNLPTLEKLPENHKISFRVRNHDNCTKCKTNLTDVDWNLMLTHHEINNNCNLFPKVTKLISTKRLQKPWISQGIIKTIQHKFTIYKSHKLGKFDFEDFEQYRNHLTNIIKCSKENHYQQWFADFHLNIRKL